MYANYFKVSMDYLIKLSSNKTGNTNILTLDKKYIGNNIKNFRNEKKITQTELADFLNTSHSTISLYETGNALILTAFTYQICILSLIYCF